MTNAIELLIDLHKMFQNGELAAEFNSKRNKMVNSDKLKAVMAEVEKVIPVSSMEPRSAANAMRNLEDRDEAIEAAGDKVVDMRKEFQLKMSQNGGALGLTKQLVEAIETADFTKVALVTADMMELVNQSD